MGLIQLIYTSYPDKLTEKEINSILFKSRIRNAEKGITGVLLRIENLFLQILEGEEETVCDLFEKIKKDERHKHCIMFSKTPVKTRSFSNSAMGYKVTKYRICSELIHETVNDDNRLFNFLIEHAGNPAIKLLQNFYNKKAAACSFT
ncbi:hypothetical protein BH10BAC5_BH10BAC5_03390 [soil metagenome]